MPAPLGKPNRIRQSSMNIPVSSITREDGTPTQGRDLGSPPPPTNIPMGKRTALGIANTMYATGGPPPPPSSRQQQGDLSNKRTVLGLQPNQQKPPPPQRQPRNVVELRPIQSTVVTSVPEYGISDSPQPAIHQLPEGNPQMLKPRRELSSTAQHSSPPEGRLRSDEIARQLQARASTITPKTRSTTPPPGRLDTSDEPATTVFEPKTTVYNPSDPDDNLPTRHFPSALPNSGGRSAAPPPIAVPARSTSIQVPPPAPGIRPPQATQFPSFGTGGSKPPPVLNPTTVPPSSALIQQSRRTTGMNLAEACAELQTCQLDELPRIAFVLASKPQTLLECYQVLSGFQEALLKTDTPKAAEKLREAIAKMKGKIEVYESIAKQRQAAEVIPAQASTEAPRVSKVPNASTVKTTGNVPVWIANTLAPFFISIGLITSQSLQKMSAIMIGFAIFAILAIYSIIKEKSTNRASRTPAKKLGYALTISLISAAIGLGIPITKKVSTMISSSNSKSTSSQTADQAKKVPTKPAPSKEPSDPSSE